MSKLQRLFQAFSGGAEAPTPEQITYASAYAAAVRSLTQAAGQPADLAQTLRARAEELDRLADLVQLAGEAACEDEDEMDEAEPEGEAPPAAEKK